MTAVQIAEFQTRYDIVNHHGNDATGFSATLFRDKTTGRYTLSFRSTEFKSEVQGGDRLRDQDGANIGIAQDGFALAQLAAAEQYYQQLKASGVLPEGAVLDVTGYSLGGHLAQVFTELHPEVSQAVVFNAAGHGAINGDIAPSVMQQALGTFKSYFDNPNAITPAQWQSTEWLQAAQRLGIGTNNDDRLLVLGELVNRAQADTTTYYDAGSTANAYASDRYLLARLGTIASYRLDGLDAGMTLSALLQLFSGDAERHAGNTSLLLGGLGYGQDARITSVFGRAANHDVQLVAHSQYSSSTWQPIYIEDQPEFETNAAASLGIDFGNTHAITLIGDSMALMRTLMKLDSSLTVKNIGNLFASMSDQRAKGFVSQEDETASEADSLDRALFQVLKVFDSAVELIDARRNPGAFGNINYRNEFYTQLKALDDVAIALNPDFSAPSVQTKLDILVQYSSSDLATLASGNDMAAAAYRYALVKLSAVAVIGNDVDYAALGTSDVSLVDVAGPAALTVNYINDRAALLVEQLKENMTDGDIAYTGGTFVDPAVRDSIVYRDAASGINFVVAAHAGIADDQSQFVLFGRDDNADTLTGALHDDRLYGGGGSDLLTAGAGNDYLEGNAGADTLAGGTGTDILVGGTGFDTYVYQSGDGFDTIIDSDGVGAIKVDGTVLSSANLVRLGALTFKSRDGAHNFSLSSDASDDTAVRLVIDGTIIVENFHEGDLGLDFSAVQERERTPTTLDIFFDDPNESRRTGEDSADHIKGTLLDNDIIDGFAGDDLIEGGSTGDEIHGGDGNDVLFADAAVNLDVVRQQLVASGSSGDRALGDGGNDVVVGNTGNDFLVGGGDHDLIVAGAGDDFAFGDGQNSPDGDDVIYAGTGTDYLDGGNGRDVLYGEDGDDWVFGNGGSDQLFGGSGTDFLKGDAYINGIALRIDVVRALVTSPQEFLTLQTLATEQGDDFIDGGAGDDLIYGDGGNDRLYGGDGDDTLYGDVDSNISANDGDDWLDGGNGNDLLIAGGGNDYLFGGADDDELQGNDGNDVLNGGDGDDLLFGQEGDDVLHGGNGADQLQGGAGNDELEGGSGDDLLFGQEGNDVLRGGLGTDQLYGGDGDDVLEGGAGHNDLFGGVGNDTYLIDGGENAIGDDGGNNRVVFNQASTANDFFVYQGTGEYAANYYVSDGSTVVCLAAGYLGTITTTFAARDGSTVSMSELLDRAPSFNISGSSSNRYLYGGGQSDLIAGQFDDDHLYGRAGDDLLIAGQGNDVIDGGTGNDLLEGDEGDDRYVFRRGDGADVVSDFDGQNVLQFEGSISMSDFGNLSIDASGTLSLDYGDGDHLDILDAANASIARIEFGDGSFITGDSLIAAARIAASNEGDPNVGLRLIGTFQADTLQGGVGFDSLIGGAGDDTLIGGDGEDTLVGGLGDDALLGGSGADRYIVRAGDGHDVIQDAQGANELSFEDGYTSENVESRYELQGNGEKSLIITRSSGAEEVRLDAATLAGFDKFVIDGQSFDRDEFIARTSTQALTLQGGTNADLVLGGRHDDTLHGGAGNDTLNGGAGDDVLDGDAGEDVLAGGTGQDTYVLKAGTGVDTIVEAPMAGEINTILLAGGLTVDQLLLSRAAGDLVLSVSGSSDAFLIEDYFTTPTSWQLTSSNGDSVALSVLVDAASNSQGTSANEQSIAAWSEGFALRLRSEVSKNGADYAAASSGTYGAYTARYAYAGAASNAVAGDDAFIDVEASSQRDSVITTGTFTYQYVEHHSHDVYTPERYVPIEEALRLGFGGGFARFEGTPKFSYDSAGNPKGIEGVYLSAGQRLVNDPDTLETVTVQTTTESVTLSDTITTLTAGASDNFIDVGLHNVVHAGAGDDIVDGHSSDAERLEAFALGGHRIFNSLGALLDGGSGNDVLLGTDGRDEIIGGAGRDFLDGGGGGDWYRTLRSGNGWDTIEDLTSAANPLFQFYGGSVPQDTVMFDAGVALNDLHYRTDPQLDETGAPTGRSTLFVWWADDSGVRITLPNAHEQALGVGIERFEFADGSSLTMPQMLELAQRQDALPTSSTTVPTLGDALVGQTVQVDGEFRWTVPGDAFVDQDENDRLTYRATLSDGSALPDWLRFDAATRTFTGYPGSDEAGAVNVLISVFDASGSSVSQSMTINVGSIPGSTIVGTDGSDELNGTDGDDIIIGGAGENILFGDGGNDTFQLTADDDAASTYWGGDGTDRILGTSGDDTLRLNDFSYYHSVELIDGGAGHDVIRIDDGYYSQIDFSQTELRHIALIQGGSGNDDITGSEGDDVIAGGAGENVLQGGGGDDTFVLSADDDGSSTYWGGDGIDRIVGTAGDDTLRLDAFGNDYSTEIIDGGAGIDVVRAGDVYYTELDFSGTELRNIALIQGGSGADNIHGSQGDDVIAGGAGENTLRGEGGDDTFLLSPDDDAASTYWGGDGADRIKGTAGDDTLRMNYFGGDYSVELIDGGDGINVIRSEDVYVADLDFSDTELRNIARIEGGSGVDVIHGSQGDDVIDGGGGSDALTGESGNDVLSGNDGYDALTAGNDNSLLFGGADDDELYAGAGGNVLAGGLGNDEIWAGDGHDVVVFNSGDGRDVVHAGEATTLSLGGALDAARIALARDGDDLIVEVSDDDAITISDWYSSQYARGVDRLQIVADAMTQFDAASNDPMLNKKVVDVDFHALVDAFDAAQAADATLAHWQVSNGWAAADAAGSDTAALGGDLAYAYAHQGTFDAANADAMRAVLKDSNFGSQRQSVALA